MASPSTSTVSDLGATGEGDDPVGLDEATALDQDEVVADPLDLGKQVRRHQDRQPEVAADAPDEVEHVVPALRVEPVRRLVEQHQPRVVHEGLRQLHALPHAGRVAPHLAVALLEQAHVAQCLGRALARSGARQPAEARHVGDELRGAHVEREAVVLRHVADQPPDCRPLGDDVEVEHLRRPGGGLDEPEQDAEERALPCAVGADEPDHAGLDLEVEPVEREHVPVALRQPAGCDEGHDREPSPAPPA